MKPFSDIVWMMRTAIFCLVVILLVGYCLPAQEGHDCFTIVVGREASADGSVMVGHNEDDKGNFLVNVFKVPFQERRKNELIILRNGGLLTQPPTTLGFLWLEIPDAEFGDAYFNERGLVITSNSCPSREDRPDLTSGGIGFNLRRIVAERAHSAREAVKIAAGLIEQFGYSSSGRNYVFADAEEGWFFHAVKGKHWVAQRVPDDRVAVMANRYTIGIVDLADKENFQGAADIVSYAVTRGWHRTEHDNDFDFATSYADPVDWKSLGNILRQWRGINLLAKKHVAVDERFPFSFEPDRKIRPTDLFRVLRDHYEGTDYDLTRNYRNGSPNTTRNRTICTESTQFSFVTQLRSDLPPEIAYLAWIAFRRPDSNAYAPWYFLITAPPSGYNRGSAEESLKNHFSPAGTRPDNPDEAFWSYAKLSELVDRQYNKRIEKAQKVWKNFENFAAKDLKNREKEFDFLLMSNRPLALKIITNYLHNLEYRRWFLASELVKEFRK